MFWQRKKDFAELASKGALNFPILCSLRVRLRRVLQRTQQNSQEAAEETQNNSQEATEDSIEALIMETTEQDLCP